MATEAITHAAISEPLEVEVFFHALRSIAEEMGTTLVRTCRSINIRERYDASCAILGADGRLIVQAEHHPAHLGALVSMVTATLRRYPSEEILPGDIFIGNDPYEGGGTHLPDVTVAAPVFYEGEIVAFVAAMGHWVDLGGRAPGAGLEGSTEIYQEGIRMPPIRIRNGGVIDRNLLDLLLANTRTPEENRLDFMAQVACTEVGQRGVVELVERYTPRRFQQLGRDVIQHSELTLRAAIARLPEVSVRFADTLDDDGIDDSPVHVQLEVTIRHEPRPHVTFDFTGSHAQRLGGVNSIRTGVYSALAYVLQALVDPFTVASAGTYEVFTVIAEERSVFDCRPPAAVGGKGPLMERVVELVIGALAPVVPEDVVACSSSTTSYFFSWRDAARATQGIHLEGIPGGMGARARKDGPDAVEVHTTNMATMPVELVERTVPVLVERFELVPDSGGPGTTRGGLASRKDYRMLGDVHFTPHGDRHKFAPWGLFGGASGAPGRFSYVRDGAETQLKSKGEGADLVAGDLLRIRTPGGGGYGDPRDRARERVEADLREGKVTPAAARTHYGYDR